MLLPQAGIGWQAHIGGLVGGVLAGWIFRDRRPRASAKPAPVTATTKVTGTAGGSLPRPPVDPPRNPAGPGG